tara:strand:+ start:5151 stop:8603 length:3453 start_codon:yes stop_codon:yes gene_type:complete
MPLTGIELASSILITTVSPVDVKYGPFSAATIADCKAIALQEVSSNFRYVGLTIGLIPANLGTSVIEYWFKDGVASNNFVLKSSGTSVTANPTLQAGDPNLDSIEIGGTNYSVTGSLNSISFARDVNFTSYTLLGTVEGANYGSIVKMTVVGTSGSVVVNSSFDILVNHSQDIHVQSFSGDYIELTVKIISNNDEDFSIWAKHNGTTVTPCNIKLFAFSTCILSNTTTDPGYTGTIYEHTSTEGWRYGGTDGTAESSNLVVDGKIGIGDANPAEMLSVNDSSNDLQMRVGSLTAGISPSIRLQGKNVANTTNYFADISLDAETGKLIFQDPGTASGSIGQNPSVLDSAGNFGIGTESPGYRLEVSSNVANGGGQLAVVNTSQDATAAPTKRAEIIYRTTDTVGTIKDSAYVRVTPDTMNNVTGSSYAIWTRKGNANPTESMRVDNTGKVGIGTNDPKEALEVSGKIRVTGTAGFLQSYRSPSSQASYIYYQDQEGASGAGAAEAYVGYTSSNKDFKIYNAQDDSVSIFTNSTRAMTVTAPSGQPRIGIGTTVPGVPLVVASTTTAQRPSTHSSGFKSTTNGNITFPTGAGWYRVLQFPSEGPGAGSSRGGSTLKLYVAGGQFGPTNWVINYFKWYQAIPNTLNNLKLEQYGPTSVLRKVRFASIVDPSNSANSIVFLEVYKAATSNSSGPTVLPCYVFFDKLIGGTDGGTPLFGTAILGTSSTLMQEAAFEPQGTRDVNLAAQYLRLNSLTPGVGGLEPFNVRLLGPSAAGTPASYSIQLPNSLPSVSNQILESNASGTLSWIATPTGGSGTVTGSGTANKLTKWSTGGTGIQDSEITDTASAITLGSDANGAETLYLDTVNRKVGFRTTVPSTAMDINGTVRVRNELNVGALGQQSLFVEGSQQGTAPYYVKMGSYGQNLITGSPAPDYTSGKQNIRTTAGFGNEGKIVDNYRYETFQITLDAFMAMGSKPTQGLSLISGSPDHVIVLADFWFYRQVRNNSNPGTWDNNTDIVIGPANLLASESTATADKNAYFRITAEALNSSQFNYAGSGESYKGSIFYQGNLNANEPFASLNYRPRGAWQTGSARNQAPKGNKVYMWYSSVNGVTNLPVFPNIGTNLTRYYIGIKYRLINLEYGVVNNADLTVINA